MAPNAAECDGKPKHPLRPSKPAQIFDAVHRRIVGGDSLTARGALCLKLECGILVQSHKVLIGVTAMTDTAILPSGSTQWEIVVKGSFEIVGYIDQSGNSFTIRPNEDSILIGIEVGPHSTKEAALSAIETHTKGTCNLII